jgi:hypothetical protein
MLNPTTNVTSVVPPTLTQLGRYLNSTNSVSASTLYIIFTGGNDFLGSFSSSLPSSSSRHPTSSAQD